MIDLEKLRRSAKRDGGDAVVTRPWLRQVLAELEEARAIKARQGVAFGLKQGQSL